MSKIEEVTEEEALQHEQEHSHSHSHDDHDHDHSHSHEGESEEIPEGANVSIHSRGEKKARALIAKLNLKKVAGVSRVVFRRTGGVVFAITEPDVYRNPATGTFIVFGEAKVDTQTQDLAQRLASLSAGAGAEAPAATDPITADLEAAVKNATLNDKPASSSSLEDDIPDEEVDVEGLNEEEIKIVMDQANVSKAKAAAGLRRNNNDMVNTIMELSA